MCVCVRAIVGRNNSFVYYYTLVYRTPRTPSSSSPSCNILFCPREIIIMVYTYEQYRCKLYAVFPVEFQCTYNLFLSRPRKSSLCVSGPLTIEWGKVALIAGKWVPIAHRSAKMLMASVGQLA